MRNEPNFEIFHQTFSSRIEIAQTLKSSHKLSFEDLSRLKKACQSLESTVSVLGQGYFEDQYRAYHAAISIFVILAEWKHSIRNAEADSQRFLSSAKLKASEIDNSMSFSLNKRLENFLSQVEKLENVAELSAIQNDLESWTLPLLLFSQFRTQNFRNNASLIHNSDSQGQETQPTTVAFLKFDIDGEPAKHWNHLKPGTSYDLTIEVRVSNWPKGAKFLSLTPVTVDSRERDWLPSFRFEKPAGEGPFSFTGTDRAVLQIAHSFGSRPYEFLYAAEFDNTNNSQEVAIVGHRRLILEGCDISKNPLSGFSNVDNHLLKIRNKLRAFPGLQSEDISNTLTILSGLGNLAAQALKGGLFEAGISEARFQQKATEMLRNRPDIGELLQSHLHASGGITDLTFRDIPIELKVEKNEVLFPEDFSCFFAQTAAYAIGLGKRIGILSVLESSPKSGPVGIIDDDIEVFHYQTDKSAIAIVVVVVRGGFPLPSSYSK